MLLRESRYSGGGGSKDSTGGVLRFSQRISTQGNQDTRTRRHVNTQKIRPGAVAPFSPSRVPKSCQDAAGPRYLSPHVSSKETVMTAVKKAEAQEVDKSVAAKWSAPLARAGWTSIPNVIFERQHALGLSSLDINILLHLAGYWWKPKDFPHPSKATLAKAIGVTPRTIQKRIAGMEAAQYIKRVARKTSSGDNDTNVYDLSGLIEHAKPFALERIEDRERRKREQTERLTRKKPLKVVK